MVRLSGFNHLIGRRAKLLEDILFMLVKRCRSMNFNPIVLPTLMENDPHFNNSNLRLFNVEYGGQNYGVLRPEGTLLHLRYLDDSPLVQRYYYWGQMFRIERAQRFRNREFFQFCTEVTGKIIDAETVVDAMRILHGCLSQLIEPDRLLLKVNYLGRKFNGTVEIEALKRGITRSEMFKEMDAGRVKINLWNYLEMDERISFVDLLRRLSGRGIAFVIDPFLTRGLNYYRRFVFEIWYGGRSLVGGGNYDGLWGKLNTRKIGYQHFGWGLGLSRLVDFLCDEDIKHD